MTGNVVGMIINGRRIIKRKKPGCKRVEN